STAPQGGGGKLGVGSGRKKVSAECEEHFHLSVVHCLNSSDGVEAMIARRLEVINVTELFQKTLGRPLPDADGAIALHVAVPAHRTEARARLADLSAQQHEVDDLLNVCDCIAVLR